MNTKYIPKHALIFNGLSVLIVISMLIAGSGNIPVSAKAPSQPLEPAPVNLEKVSAQCFGEAGTASFSPLTGYAGFAGASPVNPIQNPAAGLQAASPEEAARGYLSECGSFFGLKDQAGELTLQKQRGTEDGRMVVRFQQNYQGVPVVGGELLMQLTADNNIIMVNANLMPAVKLDPQPTLDAAVAQQTALQMVAENYGLGVDALMSSDPQLWVYSPLLIENRGAAASLVWRMEIRPVELAPIRQLVLINAHDGSVVLDINQTDTAMNRLTYTAGNTTTRPGTLVCNEADPTCAAGDADAQAAHAYAEDTYQFYATNHSRDSIDNAGMSLISTVHYSSGYCNAFWDGVQMTYGDGCSLVVDDVVAHEMTHGVTEYESGLIYAYHPGAINESFSDIWGEFMDLSNGAGNDDSSVRWLMGEDSSMGAIRDMQDPTVFGDPDRMGSPLYYDGFDDGGGVHWNSGVSNKAAYLIVDGDTFNGYTVTGIGITKAAKIYYEAQTNILVSSSNYLALRNALNQACTNLIGVSGISASDCVEVNEATLATEMDLAAAAPSNDEFAGATAISAAPYTNNQDISGATAAVVDDPAFSCTGGQMENTVWYSFTPSESGTLGVNTTGSTYDTVLGIYTGASPATLIEVACHDDVSYPTNVLSALSTPVSAGTTYYILVGAWGAGVNLQLNVGFTPADVPIIISPKGDISDRTPTFKWTEVAGATQYRFQVFRGSSVLYARTVTSSACSGSVCQNTPTTSLAYRMYKWRVQAKVGGVWQDYSAKKRFTVSGPFNDTFTSDADNWTPLNGTWTVTGGNYRGSGVASELASAVHTGGYDKFTYEVRMKRTGNCTGCANVIYFRAITTPLSDGFWDTGFYFAYTNNEYFSIYYADGGSYYNLVPWTSAPAIVGGGYNRLKIAANGTSLKFYINNVLLVSVTATGFNPSGKVGFGHFGYDGAVEKLYVDSATLNLSGLPIMAEDEKGGAFFTFDRESLVPNDGNPFVSP